MIPRALIVTFIAALAAAPFTVAAPVVDPRILAERHETPEENAARMAWFRDAHFGMFIHWGLYAQAGGVWKGKETNTNHCAEWLMLAGKVPIADYAAMAKDFNPVRYDAEAWVRAAKDAGVRYIVFTSKHHEGFAMYATKASPYNIVDATPFGRDPLKELAAACRKYGVKLGLYYSQNLDWHHQGGGSGDWDPTHKGDPDKYVDGIVIPQLKEILTDYGDIAVLWFDIGGGVINKDRSLRIQNAVLACNPHLIINNRLGGGFHGDIETPENHIPPTGFPGRDWEACMTMNRTWGFAKNDHDWKSTRTLIRNLADIASKGGNYLLNVGPDELGQIPEPSLERLAGMGAWMKTNASAIYDTRASVFPSLPVWGRVTTKVGADGDTTLNLIVFDCPADGVLKLPGLTNTITGARLLGKTDAVTFSSGEDSGEVNVPAERRGDKDFVIAVTLKGKPVVDELSRPDATGVITLSTRLAKPEGGPKLEGGGSSGLSAGPEEHIGYWTDATGTVAWSLRVPTAGDYAVSARIAALPASEGSVIEFVAGDRALPLTIKSTGDWKKFAAQPVGGALSLPAGVSKLIVRVKTLKGGAACNLGTVTLTPVK